MFAWVLFWFDLGFFANRNGWINFHEHTWNIFSLSVSSTQKMGNLTNSSRASANIPLLHNCSLLRTFSILSLLDHSISSEIDSSTGGWRFTLELSCAHHQASTRRLAVYLLIVSPVTEFHAWWQGSIWGSLSSEPNQEATLCTVGRCW